MNTLNLLLKPVITEKATSQEKNGKYMFFVRRDATKIDIKSAFKHAYGVDVVSVNVMNTHGKVRQSKKGAMAKKGSFKKVVITTKAKKNVDLTKIKTSK